MRRAARPALVAAAAVAAAAALAAPGAATAQQADAAPAALEERLLTGAAQDQVAITATFSGEDIFVYGAIERSRFLGPDEAPPDLVIVVSGPSGPVMVRRKNRVAGVWVNTESIRIASAPGFYAVASTGPLDDILFPEQIATHRILLEQQVVFLGVPISAPDPESFREALIRLRTEQGLYQADPSGVEVRGGTLFETRLSLPADIEDGDYEVRLFLVRDRTIRDEARISIEVRKQGLERVLSDAADATPLLYGVGTLFTALLAGWGASAAFRRLTGR